MDAPIPVADSHHHLWDLGGPIRYPWLQEPGGAEGYAGDNSPIRRDYLVEDFLADCGPCGVVRSVHVEAAADPRDAVAETRWVQGIADRHGYPHGIVAFAALAGEDVRAVLEAHREHANVRGIRQLLNWDADPARRQTDRGDWMTDPAWRRGFALLGPLGLSFDLHIHPWQMAGAAALAGAFPDTALVVDHTGLPADRDAEGRERWRGALRELARRPNVMIKISGLGMFDHRWTAASVRPFIDEAIDVFGPDRCMFGSNFPVDRLYSDYAALVSNFRAAIAGYSAGEQRLLLHDSAVRFYRLGS
jgi:predicted TIM-barrel fold metal-dependent hydrolase